MTFCAWPLSLGMRFMRLVHVVACISTPFLFLAEQYSIVCLHCNWLSVHLLGEIWLFPPGAIVLLLLLSSISYFPQLHTFSFLFLIIDPSLWKTHMIVSLCPGAFWRTKNRRKCCGSEKKEEEFGKEAQRQEEMERRTISKHTQMEQEAQETGWEEVPFW